MSINAKGHCTLYNNNITKLVSRPIFYKKACLWVVSMSIIIKHLLPIACIKTVTKQVYGLVMGH